MPTPDITINTAKALANSYRKKAVIILSFSNGQYQLTSYGMTRPLCNAAGRVVDRIAEAICNGDIGIPEELSQ